MDKRLRKRLEEININRRNQEILAFLGDLRNDVLFPDSTKYTYVYATVAFSGQLLTVRNMRFPSKFRLPVKLGRIGSSNQYEVIDLWHGVYPEMDLPILPPHDHTWGNSDNVSWIRKEQVTELAPSAIGGMEVQVNAGHYTIQGVRYAFAKTVFDMTAYIAVSGANWVAVEIDADGVVTYTVGDTEDSRLLLDVSNLPANRLDRYLLFACKMYEDQDEVIHLTTNSDIFDPRFVWQNLIHIDPDPLLTADSDYIAPSQSAVADYVAAQVEIIGDGVYVRKFTRTINPDVDDDDVAGYMPTDLWFNSVTSTFFKCTDDSTGAAVWQEEGVGGSGDIVWEIDGALAVSDPCDVPHLITKATTLLSVYIMGEDLGSAGNTEVEIDLNGGGSILSAPIVLAYNDANKWATVTPVVVDLVEGDILTPSTVGVATGARGLRIIVVPETTGGGGGTFSLTLEEKSAGVSVSNVGVIVVPDDSLVNNGGGEVEIITPLILLDVQTASNSASLDFTDFGVGNYEAYIFILYSLIPATNNVALYVRFSTDGGSTYDSTNLYHVSNFRMTNAASASEGQAPGSPTSRIAIPVAGGISNDANYGFCGKLMLSNKDTALYKRLQGEVSAYTTTPSMVNIVVSGAYKNATVVDGVRFVMSSGNIASGKIAMYGIRGSL